MQLEGSHIAETPSYVYLRRPMNIKNDLDEALNRKRIGAWASFEPLRKATDHLTNQLRLSVQYDRSPGTLLRSCVGRNKLPTERSRGVF